MYLFDVNIVDHFEIGRPVRGHRHEGPHGAEIGRHQRPERSRFQNVPNRQRHLQILIGFKKQFFNRNAPFS